MKLETAGDACGWKTSVASLIVCWFVRLSVGFFVCLFVCLFVYLFVCGHV